MSGVNPQGCQVTSFKVPSAEELDHDYLWRCVKQLPERGRIGIFNRSYYEEVLVTRVHPQILQNQKLPSLSKAPENDLKFWKQRFDDINNFEKYLINQGTVILKFFLHVSPEEQKKRLLERIDDPSKNWKFSIGDVNERALWPKYMEAYEEILKHTSTNAAPWYVIPADKKWFMRTVVSEIIVERLQQLKLHYPVINDEQKADLLKAQEILENEGAEK
jgi:PPK2 family polyphosphate:nucleotide phosphotransferase